MVGCAKCKKKQTNGLSMFKFPMKDPARLKFWEEFTGANFVAKPSSRLCQNEFHENQLMVTRRGLIKGAVPGKTRQEIDQVELECMTRDEEEQCLPEHTDTVELIEESGHEIKGIRCEKCKRTKADKISLFPFPHEDAAVLGLWETYICPNFKATPSSRLCSLEFDNKLVVDVRRELKPGATPGYDVSNGKADNTEKAEEDEKSKFIASMNLGGKTEKEKMQCLIDGIWERECQLKRISEKLKTFLTDGQVEFLKSDPKKPRWSQETVASCFQIYAKLGLSAYEFLRRNKKWPLVCVRTLERKIAHISFLPGVQKEFIAVLGKKNSADPIGRLMCLSSDEMTIKPHIEVDRSTRSLIGIKCPELTKVTDGEDSWPAANHLLVTVARGMAWHTKQVVRYDFVEPFTNGWENDIYSYDTYIFNLD